VLLGGGVAAPVTQADEPASGRRLGTAWVVAAAIAAAVAVPVAIHHDKEPANGPFYDEEDAGPPAEELHLDPDIRWVFPEPFPGKMAESITIEVQSTTGDQWTTKARLGFTEDKVQRLDLAPLIEATYQAVGWDPILVPYVYSDRTDLHVGVDLGRWVGDPPQFAVGDRIKITDGRSPELPGYMVCTDPQVFYLADGWRGNEPYSGDVWVGGSYGVQVVPEPATGVLLAAGGVGLIRLRRRRRASTRKGCLAVERREKCL
jgi:hypothetical protein